MSSIPDEAVMAAARSDYGSGDQYGTWETEPDEVREMYLKDARLILEAAAPHMLDEAELMRWKLGALKEWSDAMVNGSHAPQYGRDVRTLLEVESMNEAREIDAL